jgi:3'-phosphoadenosine 5'-phosphosulfate sulfotransferase (PAPS reductase)/FAD synthetase
MSRAVVWFSCGASSAIACMYAIKKYKDCKIVYCDTGGEHESNYDFLLDVQGLIGQEIIILKNENYKDHFEVFKTGYLNGVYGAKCTTELKKKLRLKYQEPDDIHIFGYTIEEKSRATKFEYNNPELFVDWVLIEKGITKENCLGILWQKGIKLPKMYELGYNHNNCIGCVKGGMGYWNQIRKDFPKHFKKMAKIERDINHSIFRDKKTNERIWLDELEIDAGNFKKEPPISCDLSCGMAIEELK